MKWGKTYKQEKITENKMQYFYQNHNSSDLIIFFAGWGCDYNQFTNLHDKKDILTLYDYQNMELDFDFSRYNNIDIIAYSAGVFVSCIVSDKLKNIRKKIALCGNPYLFDEVLGISESNIQILKNINLDNYLEFRKKYMVSTKEEYKKYNELQSLRSIESCQSELIYLQKIYKENQNKITPEFTKAIVAEDDLLFKVETQKDFYKDKLTVIKNAKHHIFFRFKSFEEMI